MGKRYTIADQQVDNIKPAVGDVVECVLTTPDGPKTVWMESVYDGGTASCEGCFGDIDFAPADDDDTETYCTELPGGCNVHNTIYKPACDESLVMVTLYKLEGRK